MKFGKFYQLRFSLEKMGVFLKINLKNSHFTNACNVALKIFLGSGSLLVASLDTHKETICLLGKPTKPKFCRELFRTSKIFLAHLMNLLNFNSSFSGSNFFLSSFFKAYL
jgi:hypothetical protein